MLTLNQTKPVDFATLYSPFGPRLSIQNGVFLDALQHQSEWWMEHLREKAGLEPGWQPPGEERTELAASE